ncbi:hypothetical protein [Filifactor villosus]|uniref:Uncharacterized protein n=1 Tax=Filifactor villosus TaxID=29374 RepID=A0ABV9QL79_9FIRM
MKTYKLYRYIDEKQIYIAEDDNNAMAKNIEYVGEIQSGLTLEQLATGFAWTAMKRFGEAQEKLESIKRLIG